MTTYHDSPHRLRNAVDIVCAGLLFLLIALTALFPAKIPHAESIARTLIVSGVVFGALSFASRAIRNAALATITHAFATVALFGIIFDLMGGFQHIIVSGWMDAPLLRAETRVLGFDLSVWMQRFVSPARTEWFMFAYMIYVPLLPAMALIAYKYGGAHATHEYTLNIVLSFAICYLGFILFPVASPLYYHPQCYSVPLDGGFFTWTSEILRTKEHYAGGSLPSPHCAAGTVMLVTFYRCNRRLFYVALPVILSLYIATVYGRFHYIEDGIAGIGTALLVARYAPAFAHAVHHITTVARRLPQPMLIRSTPHHINGELQ